MKLVYNSIVRIVLKRERERKKLIPLLNTAAYTRGTVAGCNFEPLPFIRHYNVCLAVRSYYQNNRQIEATEIECTNAAVAAPAAAVAAAAVAAVAVQKYRDGRAKEEE